MRKRNHSSLLSSSSVRIWLAAAVVVLGAADAAPAEALLTAVSCTSSAACIAVGQTGSYVPIAERWDGRIWLAQTIPNPSREGQTNLTALSCTSRKNCIAVGYYAPPLPHSGDEGDFPFAERWDGSRWTIQHTPPLPAWFDDGRPVAYLSGVSCTSSTDCIAVGNYSSHSQAASTMPLAEHWDGTNWTVQNTALPPNPPLDAIGSGGSLDAVSCVSSADCTAVGHVASAGGTFAEHWDGNAWLTETTHDPPGSYNAYLNGISCTTNTFCVAVGSFQSLADEWSHVRPLIEQWNGTTWSTQHVAQPLDATRDPSRAYTNLTAVSCTSSSTCTTVGGYVTRAPSHVYLKECWDGSRWVFIPVASPQGNDWNDLTGVSCTSGFDCQTVPHYTQPPRTTVLGHVGFVSPSGVAGVFVGCFAKHRCRGTMNIIQAGRVVAHRNSYTVSPDDAGIVHLSLSRAIRASLASPARVSVQIVYAGGSKTSSSLTLIPFGRIRPMDTAIASSAASRIAAFGHTGFLSRTGIAQAFLGCFGTRACTGSITLTVGRTVVADRPSFRISGDNGALVRIPLSSSGRALTSQQVIEVRITVRDLNGPHATSNLTLEHVE
jgi:hypothetical protein